MPTHLRSVYSASTVQWQHQVTTMELEIFTLWPFAEKSLLTPLCVRWYYSFTTPAHQGKKAQDGKGHQGSVSAE